LADNFDLKPIVSAVAGRDSLGFGTVRPLFATGALEDGTRFLIDRRAAARLPSRLGLTVRGMGRFKHLDLDLEAEQWGTLLYD